MKIRFGSSDGKIPPGGIRPYDAEVYLREIGNPLHPKRLGFLFISYAPPFRWTVEHVYTNSDRSVIYSVMTEEFCVMDVLELILNASILVTFPLSLDLFPRKPLKAVVLLSTFPSPR